MSHLLRITLATACILLLTLLPFFPGSYDSLAVPLSTICRSFGFIGLLLVPFGAIWVTSLYWSPLAGKRFVVAVAALIASSIVWLIISLLAFAAGGLLLGLAVVALGACVVWRVAPRLRALANATAGPGRTIPYALLIVPVAVALLQWASVGPATEFSRTRAIANSERLIADIEQYRATQGHYPLSLLSVNRDYLPGVIGIEQYHYEPNGDAYNLFFEQFAVAFGTREFVMYNPRDKHYMTSHKTDLLRLSPEGLALERTRGHYALNDSPNPHWKYFWFD
jgi:hypothetical protein